VALQALGQTNVGLMAVPLAAQFSNHVTAHGNYTGTELVTVMAGANDVFMYFAQAVTAVNADAFELAVQSAEAQLKADATTLASNIQTQVLDKGAKYVVLVNVPSIEKTPFGQSTGEAGAAALKRMVEAFNSTLQSALGGMAKVVVVDAYAQSLDQYQNPAQYGLKNVSLQACGPNALAGSSLACTTANVVAGVDVSTSLYADDVHPTPVGYKLLEQLIALKMAQYGWL
jgi:phospholipase/lecithinase/hemolysin